MLQNVGKMDKFLLLCFQNLQKSAIVTKKFYQEKARQKFSVFALF
jgi:hypothetical protein